VVKGQDYNEKLKAAEKYYAKKDYFRALTLYEQLQNYYSATPKAEEMMYYNAYCNYGLRQYTIAGYLFKSYVESYPAGKHAEECYYMYANCIMEETYSVELDQSNTLKAIEEYKIFANLYPESKYIEQCNTNIDKMRNKLSDKAYRNARLYYQVEDYKAAIVALNNAIKDYPDLAQREEVEFLIVKSNFLLAKNSVEEKKQERFENTRKSYQVFIENYPTSKYRKEAEYIRLQTDNYLKKFLNDNKS
jgi:outer membrane protein assembly factor BamD